MKQKTILFYNDKNNSQPRICVSEEISQNFLEIFLIYFKNLKFVNDSRDLLLRLAAITGTVFGDEKFKRDFKVNNLRYKF